MSYRYNDIFGLLSSWPPDLFRLVRDGFEVLFMNIHTHDRKVIFWTILKNILPIAQKESVFYRSTSIIIILYFMSIDIQCMVN